MSILHVKFRRTTLIACGLAAFLAGLGMARTKIELQIVWVALSLLLVIITARRMRLPAAFSVVLFGLALGWWRGAMYMKQLSWYDELAGRSVIVQGTADNDAVYTDKSQITFDIAHITVQDPIATPLVGKMTIKGLGVSMVYKGNYVQAEGKLYKTRGSKQAGISFAQIEILHNSTSVIDVVRRKFEAGMQSALPEPLASFGLGLLIGQRSTLPQDVTLALAAVGLTHVVAVSGYNLTIIMRGVRRMLKNASKYQSTVLSILLIGLFLLLTGFSASIVRAAIVSLLSLWAWYYGRSFRPIVLILLAASLTAGFYPIYIWSDIGWYLSFLAFFGVLVIAPLVSKRFYKKKKPKAVTMLVIESMAAQLMTVPLIMYIFGQFSGIAIIANILIVPLVPLAMGLCLIAGLGGMLLPAVSGWFAWPARLLLTYMLDIVNLMAGLPHALTKQPLALGQMLVLYGFVVAVTFIVWRKTHRSKTGIITDTENDFEGV